MANVQKTDGVDSAMAGLLAGMKLNADGLEGVVAANGDLASGSLALMLQSAARRARADGASHP